MMLEFLLLSNKKSSIEHCSSLASGAVSTNGGGEDSISREKKIQLFEIEKMRRGYPTIFTIFIIDS